MEEKKNIVPVLIGADLNCYNVARAFHEKYGVVSYAFGRYPVSATKYSKLVRFTTVSDIDNRDRLIGVLKDFASSHRDSRLIAMGCTDDYATLLAQIRDEIPEYTVPYPDASLQPVISRKAEFYSLCDRYGIPYPGTRVITFGDYQNKDTDTDFEYPIIIKPSSSVEYWKHPFDTMKKVYTAGSAEEASSIYDDIFGSGYREKIVVQEFIPGPDSNMRVFTAFSDSTGKVRAACLGHTMIEEHTPHGLGNHAAIVTEPVSEFPLAQKLISMLNDLRYTGFSNFDIKRYGDRPDDFRVFEINLRQGRSNYYVTSSGINIAELAAEVYDDGKDGVVLNENRFFWHHVPKKVAYTYTRDKELVAEARKLSKEGKQRSSLLYAPDLRTNPMRLAIVLEQLRRQKKKFRKYYPAD